MCLTNTLHVSAGTHIVEVRGSGSGDPLTTGYSSYGSLGQFTLTITYPELKPMVACISRALDKRFNKNNNTYTGTETFRVQDLFGANVNGAVITATWTAQLGSSSGTATCSNSRGQCVLQFVAPAAAAGCTVVINSVTFAGYRMTTDLATLAQVTTW
jgi:hypothetical protein